MYMATYAHANVIRGGQRPAYWVLPQSLYSLGAIHLAFRDGMDGTLQID